MNVKELLTTAVEQDAADIFLVPGMPFSYKIGGRIIYQGDVYKRQHPHGAGTSGPCGRGKLRDPVGFAVGVHCKKDSDCGIVFGAAHRSAGISLQRGGRRRDREMCIRDSRGGGLCGHGRYSGGRICGGNLHHLRIRLPHGLHPDHGADPVSYTHLDVYKRQQPEQSVQESKGKQGSTGNRWNDRGGSRSLPSEDPERAYREN